MLLMWKPFMFLCLHCVLCSGERDQASISDLMQQIEQLKHENYILRNSAHINETSTDTLKHDESSAIEQEQKEFKTMDIPPVIFASFW
jgi:hypothetical protein